MFRSTPEPVDELLAASHAIRTRVSAWRGGDYLGTAPLLDGDLTEQADQFVTGAVDLSVSPVDPTSGDRWTPARPTDALNVYGSRLHLSYDVQRASGGWLSTSLGWFIVDEWEDEGDAVTVSAVDVRDAIVTAKLLGPSTPKAGATFASELQALIGGRLPLDLTAAPANRAVPRSMSWSESRSEAVDELLTAWPARMELDEDGVLIVLPADLETRPADVTLREGVGGTIVKQTRSGSRDGLYNVVVARGEDTSSTTTAPVTGYAADTNPDSPTYVGGPMGELVTFFSSPLLTTRARADAAAATVLARSLRRSETVPVQCLPDPRLGVNARVDLTRSDGTVSRCVVLTSRLPLTGAGGAQTLTLGVIPDA